MLTLSCLKDAHQGQPAAVLGGGPSLPTDLERIPRGSVLIAANHHALRLTNCNYLVFLDDPTNPVCSPDLLVALQTYTGIRVTHHLAWTDVEFDTNWPNFSRYTGCLAMWFACWLGCDPVLLCGMDLYQGEKKYFYEWDAIDMRDPSFHRSARDHLDIWRPVMTSCPHSDRIKAVSGPLTALFGEW